jgi:hypothetical protein
MEVVPPGGAWRRVELRPVMTLPQFWLEPQAKELEEGADMVSEAEDFMDKTLLLARETLPCKPRNPNERRAEERPKRARGEHVGRVPWCMQSGHCRWLAACQPSTLLQDVQLCANA